MHLFAQDLSVAGALSDKGNNHSSAYTTAQTSEEGSQALDEITVVGTKNIVKREADRIVFDAQAIAAGNLNLYDLLSSTPDVLATDDGISIVGKGGALVMINDRESKLSGEELITLLKGYNSTDVDKIEVITAPSSKYDAEGSAGVINIRLKRRFGDYFGGSINDMQSFSNYNLNEYSAVLNYKQGRVSVNFTLAGRAGKRGEERRYTRHFPDYYWDSHNEQVDNSLYITPKLSLDIALPKNFSVGVILNYLYVKPDYSNKNQTTSTGDNAPFAAINGLTNYDIDINHYDANLHIEKRFGSSGKRITFDADVFERKSDIISTHESDTWLNYYSPQVRDVKNYSTRLDLHLPYERAVLNVGAKYSDSQVVLDYTNNNSSENDINDDMSYMERVAALYADADITISPKFELKMGLRMEYTHTDVNSQMTEEYKKRDFLRLFPTAYLGYTPSEKHTHSLTLSRRLGRPAFSNLTPNMKWEYEYAQSVGNPLLQEAYFYTASYGYTYKNNLSFELSYQFADDIFGEKMTMNPQTHTTLYKWMNFKKNHILQIGNSYTFNRWRWLQSHLQHSLSWTKSMSDNEESNYSQEGWSYYISLRNTFYFNRSKTFTGELSFNYQTKTFAANEILMPRYNLNAGLRRSLLKNRLILAFNVNNILASHNKGTMFDGELYTDYDHIVNYRTYRVSLTWRFGGSIAPKQHTASNSEEKSRL